MTNALRPGRPPLPVRMASRPIDKRGFPVPFFVAMVNGEPDHRVVEPRALQGCMRHGWCWLCGTPLGAYKSFVIGPMCGINRVNSEPPSHLECARYAAQVCPFLTRPHAKRREAGMPQNAKDAAGVHLKRNPGVALVWTTRNFKPFKAQGGVLFALGEPESMEWYAEGRPATLAEVEASIESGLPLLLDVARQDGEPAMRQLLDTAAAFAHRVRREFEQQKHAGGSCDP